ncbi:MAG: hypothetical protein JWM99_317 [Verrucomicrobiales bacterium]|nr:hypothetical protein [Verrucomicrobiales bacterium]
MKSFKRTIPPSPSRVAAWSTAILTAIAQTVQAANHTLVQQQAAGNDWNTGVWQPGNLGATAIVGTEPDATFEMLPGSRLRSPNNGTDDTFPGLVLTVDGDSIMAPTGSGATSSEIRFKQAGGATGSGAAMFTKLVLNGGQLDLGNDGTIVINGEVDVAKNSSLINDGTNDRGFQINAFLTGSADLAISTYAPATPDNFRPTYTHDVNIAGTTNTFSGKWNIIRGVLLGSGTNSLGTNNIVVGSAAALETTYDINNPHGNLQLNGLMYLHQNDAFRSVTVGTTALAKGTYTYDDLAAQFPTNFPATWTAMDGAVDVDGNPITTASGSIAVLEDNTSPVAITVGLAATTTVQAGVPVNLVVTATGPITSVTWLSNNVVVAAGLSLAYSSPPLSASAAGAIYKVILANNSSSATNQTTIAIINSPINITMAVQEAIGQSWETGSLWSDGNPASVSAAANAANTYEILPGARLRSPDGAATATFPGSVLTLDGNSVWNVTPPVTLGEIRFKQGNATNEDGSPTGFGTNIFPKLVLNGGQLDVGNDGTVIIQGHLDVAKDTPFSVNNATGARGYRLDAWLTGTNSIEFHGSSTAAFDPLETHNLDVNGGSNTFSGKWNIVTGTLLGTQPGALGTNDISIGANGALLTTYDINNPKGSLDLQGQMYLTQNDTFRKVKIAGTPLAKGTYAYADLSATYPNFPATWPVLIGAENATTPGGSITVLEDSFAPSVIITGPVIGTVFPNGPTNVTLTADATVEAGSIAKVEFYSGTNKLGEDTTAPYSIVWTNVDLGKYAVTARATTANGEFALSGQTLVTVGTPISINFQTSTAATPDGYLADVGTVYGDQGNGYSYGWDIDNTANARERNSVNSPDKRYDTFTHMQKPQPAGSVWEIAVPNGRYLVTGVSGDPDNFDSVFDVQAEGVTFISGTPSTDTSARFIAGRGTVTVADGKLTISNGPLAANSKINFLDIFALPASGTPQRATLSDVKVQGGNLVFTFNSEAGHAYNVRSSSTVTTPLAQWTVAPVTATGTTTTYSTPATAGAQFFVVESL